MPFAQASDRHQRPLSCEILVMPADSWRVRAGWAIERRIIARGNLP
jgi:hypothetical protein